MVPKKRRGPEPTGQGAQVQVRIHEPMLTQIDEWAKKSAREDALSRPEAIRRLVEIGLEHGSNHTSGRRQQGSRSSRLNLKAEKPPKQ